MSDILHITCLAQSKHSIDVHCFCFYRTRLRRSGGGKHGAVCLVPQRVRCAVNPHNCSGRANPATWSTFIPSGVRPSRHLSAQAPALKVCALPQQRKRGPCPAIRFPPKPRKDHAHPLDSPLLGRVPPDGDKPLCVLHSVLPASFPGLVQQPITSTSLTPASF